MQLAKEGHTPHETLLSSESISTQSLIKIDKCGARPCTAPCRAVKSVEMPNGTSERLRSDLLSGREVSDALVYTVNVILNSLRRTATPRMLWNIIGETN